MAENARKGFKALAVNYKSNNPPCSCPHCISKNDSGMRQDLALTCSCEDCRESKTCLYYTKRSGGLSDKKSDASCAQSNPPGNPAETIKELIGTNLCQLYNRFKSTTFLTPSPASETKPNKECVLEKCSCIRDQTYGAMTATLQKQKSIVEIQKKAYLSKCKPKNGCILEKCSCIGDHTYRIMTATLQKQESMVEIQKKAYLRKKEKHTCIMQTNSCSPVQSKDKKESPHRCGTCFGSQVPKLYHMQELPDYLKGAPGYIFDVPKISCHKQDSSKVPKSCHKQESSEVPKSCHKKESSEVSRICCHKQESPKVPKSCHRQESSEVPKLCHKQESPDLMKGAAGYVFDIPKICGDKQESPDLTKRAAGYVLDKLKICGDKQESPNPMKSAAGYVIELPKTDIDKRQCYKENKIEKHKKVKNNKCNCNMYNESETSSSSKTKTARFGSENATQELNINKLESKRTISDTMRIYSKTKNISDPQQYKPTKNAQGSCQNILQTQENSFKMDNTLSGYVHELPAYSFTRKKSCDCKESDENKSAPRNILECVTELQTCKTSSHEPANKFGMKAKAVASDSKYKLVKKRSCEAPGYVWVVPKHSAKHNDLKKQKCDCKELAKYKSDKWGYGFEQKNKTNSCAFTEPATRKPTLPGRAYDIPIFREIDNAESVCKNKESSDSKCKQKSENEPSGCVYPHDLKKCTHTIPSQKSSCVCRESAKNKSASPEKAQELTKCTHKIPSQKRSCVCRESAKKKPASPEDAQELAKCAHKIPSQKRSCVCRESAKKKPASPEDAQELAKCAHKIPSQKSSCICYESTKKKSASTEDAQELEKCAHKISSQKSSCVCHESTKKKSASTEDAQELAKVTHKPQSQKSSRECSESVSKAGKIQAGSSGYVFVVPQETKESCGCTKPAENDSKSLHKAANNEELESKCIQPDIQSIQCCKSMPGTQTNKIETFESLEITHPAPKSKVILKNHHSCCSVEVPDTTQKCKNSATQSANLSAEVLFQMPKAEFNDCLIYRQSNMANKQKNISKYDIIKRLKEAYKACSCKICDCFTSTKSIKIDAYKYGLECDEYLRSILLLGTNEEPLCSCKPCDCVQCTKNDVVQCNCDPCDCGDCKTRSTSKGQSFFVAPVVTEENAPRTACTCSPCACIECGLVYPLTSRIVNEMSTSTNRHALCRCEICLNENCDQSGLDSCKCQKHKVMSKPVEHDTHEFDIRTASILHNTPRFQRIGKSDTISMFASIPGKYPTFNKRLSNTQASSCSECECIFCVCQKDANTAIKSSQLFSSNKAESKSDFNDRYNNYELKMPYECHLYKKIQSHDTLCDCGTRDCIHSETSNVPENLHRFRRHPYTDGPYERCIKKGSLGRVLRPYKTGDVLTPSPHKLKVQKLILQKHQLEEPSCSILTVTTNTDSSSKLRDVDVCSELTSEFNTSNRKKDSITQANINMSDFNKKNIHKCDAYQEMNKRRSLHKNIAIDSETGSCFSNHSSFYYKRYGSNTLISRNKPRESSCYSSGYIYPEYFIQFPKETAETSLKEDVLKLDMEETIKLDKCNIIQNSTEKPNVDNIISVSYDNMLCYENSSMINKCNHFSNNKLIAGSTESNNNNSENAHIACLGRNCKNSLHVQLNNQNDNNTNYENNVLLQERVSNELQKCVCLKSSQSSLKMNNESREYMNAIHDFNEFHVSHNVFYNIAEENSCNRLFPILDKRYTRKCPKQTTHSNLGNGAEILNVGDYRRVRNTLKEAKKFSLELMRLLKTYEKANIEFESISEKLKLSHPI